MVPQRPVTHFSLPTVNVPSPVHSAHLPPPGSGGREGRGGSGRRLVCPVPPVPREVAGGVQKEVRTPTDETPTRDRVLDHHWWSETGV